MISLSNDSTSIDTKLWYIQAEESGIETCVKEKKYNVNPFETNVTDSNIGFDTFESNKKVSNKNVTHKTKNYKVKKGENWYKIVQQEYGVQEHNKIMEIVHKLKDENKVDYKSNIMPTTIKLLSNVILKNGDLAALLNPPVEEEPSPVKTDDKEKPVSAETENEEVPVIQQKAENVQAEQNVSQTSSEETKKGNTNTDKISNICYAEYTKTLVEHLANGLTFKTTQMHVTNAWYDEIIPDKKDENGNVIEKGLVVFRCDQGIFLIDKNGLPYGEPITEEDLQTFLEMLEE